MFRRSYVVGSLLLLATATILGWRMTHVTDADLARYEKLVTTTEEEPKLQRGEPGQQRELVHKDIWIASTSGRLHYQIACDSSTLEVLLTGRSPEVVEHMEGVSGMMQEALFWVLPDGREVVADGPGRYRLRGSTQVFTQAAPSVDWTPMQDLRWLEAAKASYFYKSNHFVAEQAKLMRLRAEGHELITTPDGLDPIITGTARSAEFFLAGKGVDFRANHLKATIYGGGGLL